MLVDANRLEGHPFSERVFDVCVCGAGVAGITLARELGRKGLTVALMEGGGREFSEESQELYAGEIVGSEYHDLTHPRLRYFGGTSNHWQGWCLPLDEHDFEPKPYQDWSGWPIRKADLDPYLAAARAVLDIPEDAVRPAPALPLEPDTLRPFRVWFSPPTRFSEKYGEELKAAGNIHLVLNANLVGMVLDDALGHILRCEFRDYERAEPFSVAAKAYVLCLGGLETPRMLLAAAQQLPGGIGNQHDLVGRFFSDHPHFSVGRYILNDENPSVPDVLHDESLQSPNNITFLAPTEGFLRKRHVSSFGLRLVPYSGFARDRPGVGAFLQRQICGSDFAIRLAEAVRGRVPPWWDCFDGKIRIATEQAPNYDSRVALSERTDRFGLPRIRLDWRLGEIDRKTIRTATIELGRQFAVTDWGRVQIDDWVLDRDLPMPGLGEDEYTGMHHIGTTRMGEDPRRGVVDRDLKVFGQDNLFVCGSSIFSTAGHANPTFTIVQLALRLTNHLDTMLATR